MCFVNLFKFKKKKQVQDCSKEFLGNKNSISKKKKDFLEKPLVTMIIT